jgi:GH15 family glucan-1,4-alpha-glucosidase
VLAWAALNFAVRALDDFGYTGPRDRWKATADEIHADVCANAFDAKRNTFVQSYGSNALDAALLMMPVVGFIPADDPRMRGTTDALEAALMQDGFLYRTTADPETQAAHSEPEGAFLAVNFWLVDNYVLQGRFDDAWELFEKLIGVANDVGMLSEEYDPTLKRLVGNLPQTLSHASLVNTAARLHTLSRTAASKE